MLPTFVILGVMKCGTTSLHYYLAEHPEVCMPAKKETDFFVVEKNYGRGLAWYESLFAQPAKACGEASPNYAKTWEFAGMPERMHAALPTAKLIYMVRDPIPRMISQYKHLYASGQEHRPLSAALADRQHAPYVRDSLYYRNLTPYFEHYSREQILILAAEELQHDRSATMRRVFEFIGVDPLFQSPGFERQWHRTEEKFTKQRTFYNLLLSRKWMHTLIRKRWNPLLRPRPPAECQLDESLKSRLVDLVRDDVQQLRQLSGLPLAGWCV
jgi:hypothetical protein